MGIGGVSGWRLYQLKRQLDTTNPAEGEWALRRRKVTPRKCQPQADSSGSTSSRGGKAVAGQSPASAYISAKPIKQVRRDPRSASCWHRLCDILVPDLFPSKGHTAAVRSAAFSPDDASGDGE
jgi:hypothetical protein